MSLSNYESKNNSFFSSEEKKYSVNKSSSEDLFDIIKGLNIIDPEKLTTEETTDILKRIDDYNGLYSTQQLTNIDYRNFKEHVFFDSAVSKVSYAFDRIQNIPYDQDETENLKYFNKTDGYTYYILKDLYPKHKGHIKFSGSNKLVIYDHQGKIFGDSKSQKIGVLNPMSKRFSFDFWLKVDKDNFTNNQVIFKKYDHNEKNGFLCFLSDLSTDLKSCNLNFVVFVENKYFFAKTQILISNDSGNIFQNVVINFDNSVENKKIKFFIQGNLVSDSDITYISTSNRVCSFKKSFSKNNLPLTLGGIFLIEEDNSVLNSLTLNLEGEEKVFSNFSGAIDEFRFFHKLRSSKKIKLESNKNIYAQKDLVLYLRLNEPPGEHVNCCLAIDYSGNKLHGIVYEHDLETNANKMSINTTSIFESFSPLKHEKLIDSPVLNSAFLEVKELRKQLIEKGKKYDISNPNLIFNLLPKHYFLESADLQNLPTYSNESESPEISALHDENGNLDNSRNSSLKLEMPANNEIVNIVIIWARFFDQLKAYIGSVTNFLNVDYDTINNEKIIGMQIPILCKMYGIKFNEILPSPTKSKLENRNLTFEDLTSEVSIRKIQNILWNRFLINTQDFLSSKGTIKSIETAFRSFGIDYTNLVDIKERSSYNDLTKSLYSNLKTKVFDKFFINFGSSADIGTDPIYSDETVSSHSENKLLFLIENIKSFKNDSKSVLYNNGEYIVDNSKLITGLNTDWSIEVYFNFNESIEKLRLANNTAFNSFYKRKQCLFRLETNGYPTLTVFFEKTKSDFSSVGNINIEIQPVYNNDNFNVSMTLKEVDIFEFPQYFCLSQKSDFENNLITYTANIFDIADIVPGKVAKSASYVTQKIIRENNFGEIEKNMSDFFNIDNDVTLSNNISFYNNDVNLAIGSYNYKLDTNGLSLLFDDLDDTNFEGKIYGLRVWNKALNKREKTFHSMSINHVGVEDSINLYQNLVYDLEVKDTESETSGDFNVYYLQDKNMIKKSNNDPENTTSSLNTASFMTKNNNYELDNIINIESVTCKSLDAKIDEPFKENNFNIISFEDEKYKLKNNNYTKFPSHSLPEDYKDSTIEKVTVEMSIAKIINDDISRLIVDLNRFTSLLSNSTTLYDSSYKELEIIRKDYFSKYSDKNLINYSSINNIFKYFDNIMSSILFDILPSSVKFDGFNYVYESHILERHKYQYKNKESLFSVVDDNNLTNYSREISGQRRSINYDNNRKMVRTS